MPSPGTSATRAEAAPPVATLAPRRRDSRIDVLRGLALAMIFINHVPGTVLEHFTSRNFGFSDAAEAFVLISGVSAALAYAGGLTGQKLWGGVRKIWRRAWTLYLVHILLSFWAIAIVASTLHFGGEPGLMQKDNFQFLARDPFGVLIGLPVLGHQFGYVNILPLYTVLLLAAPGILLAALRWPRATLAGSVALWAAAGLSGFNLPAYPLPGGWFFDPFSWQLLFTIGLLTGLAMRENRRFVPRSRFLTVLAAGFLVLSLLWVKWPAFGQAANAGLGWLSVHGVPGLLRNFDKTYVSVPRLLHILALAYVVSTLPGLRRLCDGRMLAPLALMGRQALPVFALGTLLSFAVRAVFELSETRTDLSDAVLVGAGLMVLLAFAALLELSRRAAAEKGSVARIDPPAPRQQPPAMPGQSPLARAAR